MIRRGFLKSVIAAVAGGLSLVPGISRPAAKVAIQPVAMLTREQWEALFRDPDFLVSAMKKLQDCEELAALHSKLYNPGWGGTASYSAYEWFESSPADCGVQCEAGAIHSWRALGLG